MPVAAWWWAVTEPGVAPVWEDPEIKVGSGAHVCSWIRIHVTLWVRYGFADAGRAYKGSCSDLFSALSMTFVMRLSDPGVVPVWQRLSKMADREELVFSAQLSETAERFLPLPPPPTHLTPSNMLTTHC